MSLVCDVSWKGRVDMKIAFVGVPSSGKTTTARAIAKEMGGLFVPEVARVLIEVKGRPPKQNEQEFIMRMQSQLENNMPGPLVVCDVPVFLNHLYCNFYHEENKELYEIAKKHKYDWIFKLSPLPYKEDGVRYQTEEEIEQIDKLIDEYQNDFGQFIFIEPTDINERTKLIKEWVEL